jgi:uncharacterized protein YbjT (DUF2867 family)
MIFLAAYFAYALALSLALGGVGFRAGGQRSPARGGRLRPTRILIVGATGGTGRQLVAQALDHGYQVTALARDPARLKVEHPRLRIVRGDVLDPSSLDAAVTGQEAVLSALGHGQFFRPTRIQSEGTRNLLRAMESHGVRRFIGESALGLGDSAFRIGLLYTSFVIPVILPFYFWDKARQERVIAASSADWTMVRPGVLTNGPREGKVRHGHAVGSYLRAPRVSRADTAAFMLEQLADDQYLHAAPGLCL